MEAGHSFEQPSAERGRAAQTQPRGVKRDSAAVDRGRDLDAAQPGSPGQGGHPGRRPQGDRGPGRPPAQDLVDRRLAEHDLDVDGCGHEHVHRRRLDVHVAGDDVDLVDVVFLPPNIVGVDGDVSELPDRGPEGPGVGAELAQHERHGNVADPHLEIAPDELRRDGAEHLTEHASG